MLNKNSADEDEREVSIDNFWWKITKKGRMAVITKIINYAFMTVRKPRKLVLFHHVKKSR